MVPWKTDLSIWGTTMPKELKMKWNDEEASPNSLSIKIIPPPIPQAMTWRTMLLLALQVTWALKYFEYETFSPSE